MRPAALALAGLALVLTGCAGSDRPAPAASPVPKRGGVVRVPQVMAPAGLAGVIGAAPEALVARFGPPRIDLAEGDARKLQFADETCVLDIYLYPVTAIAAPTATHVAARQRQGGAALDPGACIRALENR